MYGPPLASDGNKRLAVWTTCERDNVTIGAASKRNGSGGAGGSGYIVDMEHLARPNDELRPDVRGKCAQRRLF